MDQYTENCENFEGENYEVTVYSGWYKKDQTTPNSVPAIWEKKEGGGDIFSK